MIGNRQIVKSKRMIVISFDALGSTDFKKLKKLPNFAAFLKKAAYSSQVRSVYPSLTYPAHVSIVTGRLPKDHGVINNTLIQPKRLSPDWCWQRNYIKGTTLYDEAMAHGLKVAALLWPVTAGADITWNMPEIFANRPWSNQIITSLANGSPMYQFILDRKYGSLRDGIRQPALDNFVHESTKYTLKTHRPDLMLVHMTDLDTTRHEHGMYSHEAEIALIRHDIRLGELMNLMQECEMDIEKDTTLVLLGDHSQIDVDKVILLNKIFADRGYLKAEGSRITSWRVLCKNCDGSAYIYIGRNGLDKEQYRSLRNEVGELLLTMKQNRDSGIAAVYSGKRAKEMGADPDCAFMLEARSGYYFQDELSEDDIVKRQYATHGYHPTRKAYQTVFMAAGPDIIPGVDFGEMSLIDEGPTLAALMGMELPGAYGQVRHEIMGFTKK